jgi:membrane protease YdiL (CAAX protease family)
MDFKMGDEALSGDKRNAFHRQRPVLFAVLISTVVVIGVGGIGLALAKILVGTTEGPKALVVSQLPLVLVCLWFVHRSAGTLGFFDVRQWRSFRLLFIPGLLGLLSALGMVGNSDFSQFGWKVAGNLMIGVFEEAGFRGVVLVALVRAWGSTSKGLVRAIVVSSALFGLLHLLNLRKEPVVPTLLQVVFATFVGICFAGVLLRTRALLLLMLIHGLIDLFGDLQVKSDAPATVSNALSACLITLPFGLAGWWVVRRRTRDTTIPELSKP